MKNAAAVLGTSIVLTIGLFTAGCSSETPATDDAADTSKAISAPAVTTSVAAPAPAPGPTAAPGSGQTLADYIAANNITKTVVNPGDPGPTIDLPVPAGWTKAPPSAESTYGGLVFSAPVSPNHPPRVDVNLFKLTGDVDDDQVLAAAATDLKSIPGFQSLGDNNDATLSGFRASQAGGGYTKDGNDMLVAQKTVIIPTEGGMFILQLKAEGLESDMGPLMDATSVIDKQTKITAA